MLSVAYDIVMIGVGIYLVWILIELIGLAEFWVISKFIDGGRSFSDMMEAREYNKHQRKRKILRYK